MKHKNKKSICQSINPFLGFGWNTDYKIKKKQTTIYIKPQEYICNIAEKNQ